MKLKSNYHLQNITLGTSLYKISLPHFFIHSFFHILYAHKGKGFV